MPAVGGTILVVDDTPASLKVISDCLVEAGFEIFVAQDGLSCLNIARDEPPDLILMDVMMPLMDGFEACRCLKADAATRAIPVVFMTALADVESKVRGFKAGGVDYITKPFQLEEVLARVQTHMTLCRVQQELQGRNLQLQQAHQKLELRVAERTAELRAANSRLKREIEERKLAEEKYHLVMEASPVPIVASDMQGRVIYLNPAFTRVFGWTLAELAGREIDFVPEQALRETRQMLARLQRGESCSGFETRRFNKQGQILDIILSLDVWRDRHGQPEGNVVILHDITEQKKMVAQYHQAQKMDAIGKLTGGVAHDFNNILTVILGVTELMFRQFGPDDALHARLDQIHSAAVRASDLVRRLLGFGRQQSLQPRILNINTIVTGFEKMLRRVIDEHIELQIVLDPQLGQVKADPGQIEQVLMNLVINARDAMPEGGRLTIETANITLDEDSARHQADAGAGTFVRLSVIDTGIGMDASTQGHLFEPFFTTKPLGKGTGLGLSVVHGIVDQSGGHIQVRSQPGQGACFMIHLPQVQAPVQQAEPPLVRMNPKGGSETVLVVEDEDIVRDVVCEALSIVGYRVLAAENSVMAQQVCTGHPEPIQLLVTDMVIPGGQSGMQLAEAFSARYPQMKVLYMSGYARTENPINGDPIPASHFIRKPFMLEELTDKVRSILDGNGPGGNADQTSSIGPQSPI
jgi:two-component system cell cycle sensor histidine kinase/response regulator CckA